MLKAYNLHHCQQGTIIGLLRHICVPPLADLTGKKITHHNLHPLQWSRFRASGRRCSFNCGEKSWKTFRVIEFGYFVTNRDNRNIMILYLWNVYPCVVFYKLCFLYYKLSTNSVISEDSTYFLWILIKYKKYTVQHFKTCLIW